MASPFKTVGKNENGHSDYVRAGVYISPVFHNDKWEDCWDQSSYDHVVMLDGPDGAGGHYVCCPYCNGEIIFIKHRYRCLDCEQIISKAKIEKRVGFHILHGLEDEYFEQDSEYNILKEYTFKTRNDKAGLTPRNI